ncbi:MAG: hypothetical protein IJ852_04480 [Alphaproteobacteria bacterium]|nr:hypothetical protein [Alphaproteobacteria bacterium]
MRTKTNIFPTNLRQECAEDAPQKEKILRQERGAEAPQKEKILRPECGAEAPTFLSAVYKRGTQAKKRQAYAPQYGRSMIEMLGVLAIIGVLTVGSITGYSRAMRRHLLNKQREQISYILSAAETHYNMINPSNLSSYSLKPIFETFGWIPEEMIRENDNTYIYDVFKNKIYPYYHRIGFMGLRIELANDNPREQCVSLYQMLKQYHSFLWATEVQKTDNSYVNLYYGDQYCIGSPKCIRDLTPAKISELCRVCDDEQSCDLFILWK